MRWRLRSRPFLPPNSALCSLQVAHRQDGSGYLTANEFVDLREIARPEQNCLAIDKTRLVGWIKGLRKGLDKPARPHAGRPSDATLVHEIFRERRTRKLPLVKKRTEAKEIRAEIELRHPEHDPPAVKTIEGPLRISTAKSS